MSQKPVEQREEQGQQQRQAHDGGGGVLWFLVAATLAACSTMQSGGSPSDGSALSDDGPVSADGGSGPAADGGASVSDGPVVSVDGSGAPDLATVYTLTVEQQSTGTTTGTVKTSGGSTGIDCGATCSARYPSGTVVQLTASAGADTAFVEWTGGDCDHRTDPVCAVTMTADKAVTAHFVQTFGLTVHLTGTGTPTAGDAVAMPPNADCTAASCVQRYALGAMVTLTAKPGAKRVFDGWSGGACTSNPTPGQCVVTMTQAQDVTALFRPRYTVTVVKSGGGNGVAYSTPSGINCGATCAADFVEGTDLTLTSNVDGSTASMSWSGCDSTATDICYLDKLAGDRTVTATYVPKLKVQLTVADPGCLGVGLVTSTPAGFNCDAAGHGACAVFFDPGTSLTLHGTYDPTVFNFGFGSPCPGGTDWCSITVNAPMTIPYCFAHR